MFHTDIDVQISSYEAIAVLSSIMLEEGDFDPATFDAYVDNFDEVQEYMTMVITSKVSSKKDKARVLRVRDVQNLVAVCFCCPPPASSSSSSSSCYSSSSYYSSSSLRMCVRVCFFLFW